jgi:hypothetical protein
VSDETEVLPRHELIAGELPPSDVRITLIIIVCLQVVSAAGWRRIDEMEVSRGELLQKPREKITTINSLLDAGAGI